MLLNINNAEGTREAMRISYKKHLRGAQRNMISHDTSPHHLGLYGALGSRYKSRGIFKTEVVIWAELAPFMLMQEKDAIELIAEYVVFQERPLEAKKYWLKSIINEAIRRVPVSSEQPRQLAALGLINQVAWCSLLDQDIKTTLEEEAEKMASGLDGNHEVN